MLLHTSQPPSLYLEPTLTYHRRCSQSPVVPPLAARREKSSKCELTPTDVQSNQAANILLCPQPPLQTGKQLRLCDRHKVKESHVALVAAVATRCDRLEKGKEMCHYTTAACLLR